MHNSLTVVSQTAPPHLKKKKSKNSFRVETVALTRISAGLIQHQAANLRTILKERIMLRSR